MYRLIHPEPEVYEIDVLNADDSQLERISNDLGLNLNLDEMHRVKGYFAEKGRNPTDIELQSIAQAWSEHCCYKSSKYYLKKYLLGYRPDYVLSTTDDAGVVEFDENYAYVIGFESHNHPSAIEPYGGAATGIGGILRDVVCMGAQPVALIDPLFFGEPDTAHENLPKGTKHPLYLVSGVVAGIRDYGNRVGIPTVSGMVFFDNSYLTNCLVNVGCIGIARKDRVIPSRVGGKGEVIILAGGATGRDGIHGVTFASAELDETSEETSRSAVQLGNPIMKEPLMHACLEIVEKGLVSGMKDLGGGGLSGAVGEMSLAGNCGAKVWLDKVHLKEEGMKPWEIWVSESQERMLLSIKPQHVDEVLHIFAKWDVPARIIGVTTDDKKMRVYWGDRLIYDMDIEFVSKGPEYCRTYVAKEPEKEFGDEIRDVGNHESLILEMLSHPNVASKEWVIRQYDHEVRAGTALKPLQGILGHEGHGDAAVIKPTESFRGIAVTADVNPWMTAVDPFWGSASSFDEMVRNLVAVNSRPHSFVDCLNFGNPEKPDRMGEFVESVKALGWMSKEFGMPVVSGNVSFYNETPYGAIAPTPSLIGVGIVEDVRKAVTADFKKEGSVIILVGDTEKEFGGSLYSKITGMQSPRVPRTDPAKLRKYVNAMLEAFSKFKIRACHDVSTGGVAVALAEMAFSGQVGFQVELGNYIELFSESNTRWIVESDEELVEFLQGKGVSAKVIGYTGGDALDYGIASVDFDRAEKAWREGFSKYMG
ncbi:phosphoribosylformylglycinamidine synthase subunit PurL [Geoglobus acetivorans]|uniref:Phosphoribosylformylglycinamidine synthase subunit PurL n=1 Tax=Geoglobus acetivorans TaxID=565033 RepID=A0ABZ3H632_GEOAI|nr:phosphoribosylformylglycinamidine synthase subunit PurL [Geoglobus acetivorans]